MLTVLVAVVLASLLVLEWWYQWRLLRLGAVTFALGVLAFAQPGSWRAARSALDLPATERLHSWPGGGRALSDYESGVLTMHEMVVADGQIGATARLLGLGTLVWLAVSPTLREIRGGPRSATHRELAGEGSATPAA